MAEIFLYLVNMSITASWLILAVVLLRLLLRKAPKWVNCLLWCLVGIRLLFPVSIESVFSLIPSVDVVPQEILYAESPAIDSGMKQVNQVFNPALQSSFSPNPGDSVNPLQVVTFVASSVWVIGMVILLLYTLITYFGLKRRVREAVRLEGNVYQSERIVSPFVLGFIRPRIYVPYSLYEDELKCVIAHEQAHIKRRDYLWKPVAFLVLTVYWFNPLIWVAYILLCRDIEFACDEKVMAQLGEEKKKIYSAALLHCSVSGETYRKMIAACPVAFGEVGVKDRIRSVLNYKKPTFWMIVVALLACVVCAVCFVTNPKEDGETASENQEVDSVALFERSGIDASEISWENVSQIAIYADGYYGRILEQPLLITDKEQLDELVRLANPSVQKYRQAEAQMEGLCGIFVDFGNGVVLSMYAGENYGMISKQMQTTGTVCVNFPQELYDKVTNLLSNHIPMQKDTYIQNQMQQSVEIGFIQMDLEDAVTIEAQVKELMVDKEECIVITSKTDSFPGAFELRVPVEVYDENNLRGGDMILVTMRDTKMESDTGLPIFKALYLEQQENESQNLNIEVGEKFAEEVNTLSGITMLMEKYKATEGEVVFTNNTDKELQYGEYYDIQVQVDGEWHSLQPLGEFVYHMLGYPIDAGTSRTWTVNWELVYGALPVGEYRIVKDVIDYRAPGDYTKYYLAAEFEIMPPH